MKRFLIIILSTILLCSCTKQTSKLSNSTISTEHSISQQVLKHQLPINFTIEKVKDALLEYINYRLYLYPATIMDATTVKDMDNYIGKSVDIEIRIYNNASEKKVYAHTSMGKWLAILEYKDGFVYCGGQAIEGEYGWPDDIENFEVVETYSIDIPEPHKPNYGTSERKNKMISAFEAEIKAACSEFYECEDATSDWENVEVYIADFFERDNAARAWLCCQDNSITLFPVCFEERGDKVSTHHIKGFTLKNKEQFNEFGLYQFEKDIENAVSHFKWNVK